MGVRRPAFQSRERDDRRPPGPPRGSDDRRPPRPYQGRDRDDRRPARPPRTADDRRVPSPTARERAEEVLEGRAPFVPPAPPAPPPGTRLIDVTEIETRIEKLVAGGDGLARFQGVPIFIPRAAPGDLVRARIVERKPDYGRAEIVQILEPGPARRPDPVPELTRSSIADLQHLEDDMQTRLKVQAVRETLEHLGHLVLPADVACAPSSTPRPTR